MLKLKKGSCMLNNLISSHHAQKFKSPVKVFTVIFALLLLSACSSVPEEIRNISSGLNSSNSETYTDAISAMKSGKSKKAQKLLEKVVNQQPDFANAHVNLGIVLISNNLLNEAEKSLLYAIKIDSNNMQAFNQLGFIYRKKGDFSKAKKAYKNAIDINSDYAFAHLNLGILYDLYLYDLENAIEQYKIYLDLSKEDKKVSKWIFELERRHKKSLSQK